MNQLSDIDPGGRWSIPICSVIKRRQAALVWWLSHCQRYRADGSVSMKAGSYFATFHSLCRILLTFVISNTRSHCLGGYITRIVVGDDGLDVGEEIAIKLEVAHPEYDFGLDKNDIGLIFLQKSVAIDVPLLRLNDVSSLPAPGSTVYVMGWGDTDAARSIQNMPDELMIVELEVISNADCEKAESGTDSYDGYIFDDMLCTEHEGQDACQGDSGENITMFDVRSTSTSRRLSAQRSCSLFHVGGPLIIPGYDPESDVQVGVVSWGIGCAFLPGVFSRVSTNYGWILQTVCGSSKDPPVSLCGDATDLDQVQVQ